MDMVVGFTVQSGFLLAQNVLQVPFIKPHFLSLGVFTAWMLATSDWEPGACFKYAQRLAVLNIEYLDQSQNDRHSLRGYRLFCLRYLFTP